MENGFEIQDTELKYLLNGNIQTLPFNSITRISNEKSEYSKYNKLFITFLSISLLILFYYIYIITNPVPSYDEIMMVDRTGQREGLTVSLTSPFFLLFLISSFYFIYKRNKQRFRDLNFIYIEFKHGVSIQSVILWSGKKEECDNYIQIINDKIQINKL